jgi:hypothetical protein
MNFFLVLLFIASFYAIIKIVKNYINYGFKENLTAKKARKKADNSENKKINDFINFCLNKVKEESSGCKYEVAVSAKYFQDLKIIEKAVEKLKSKGFEIVLNYTDSSKEFVDYIIIRW